MLDHATTRVTTTDGQGPAVEVIATKADYRRFLAADLASHGLARWRRRDGMRHTELSFQRLLRRLEYLENCRRDPAGRILAAIAVWRYKRRSILLGFTVPRNAFGPGLSIARYGSIVVSGNARIGRNCRIHSDVNIGETNGLAPRIGNNVYIGPGAAGTPPFALRRNIVAAVSSRHKRGAAVEILNNTLVERAQAFVPKSDEQVEWASPLLSPTPAPAHRLAAQLAGAEKALVEIAQDVQALAVQVQRLAAQVAELSADA